MQNHQEHINIFRSLFKGREDVFAVRWEKGSKSGYMPAYFYDPYRLRAHKISGGTFRDFTDKSYLKLTDEQIQKHLDGFHQIGIYPLLQDNTTWFLATDFDKANWQKEAITFLNACQEKGIPAYLERSRSGNGGHVWVFFDKPYPAIRSRKIFISILEQSGAFSMFDRSSSFDRLFPNQDFLSGKGFGNLIALPLFKPTFENGKLVSQLALSTDIERINKEVVEGVKFQFLNKGLLKQFTPKKQNILTSDELQEKGKIYSNADELLNKILKNKQYKHSQHIQYLADRHESQVMKIRFVLNPFSFVFLLSGEQNYFVVLETLDTEEATYIWHTPKYKASLIEEVKQIENQLNIIREKGRQTFLEKSPDNFTRIIHDYSDNKKGFIIWKSAIEELI